MPKDLNGGMLPRASDMPTVLFENYTPVDLHFALMNAD